MDKFNFITIGYDCSPAYALRILNMRPFALPFDWVESNITSLEKCFHTHFKFFYTKLRLNKKRTRLIDYHGFQFPHDYPTIKHTVPDDEDNFYNENIIVNNWSDFYKENLEKYKRRIERFNNILNDDKPIIILCRYPNSHVIFLRKLFIKYYNKNNLIFVNSNPDKMFIKIDDTYILSCNTDINTWNEAKIWEENILNIINPDFLDTAIDTDIYNWHKLIKNPTPIPITKKRFAMTFT
tara:strand:- start:8902 stop:9615 length:714 start_codon:yes stop_codon:yes gene_type:complete